MKKCVAKAARFCDTRSPPITLPTVGHTKSTRSVVQVGVAQHIKTCVRMRKDFGLSTLNPRSEQRLVRVL